MARPDYLLPFAARSNWDGFFAIAVFPATSPVRWVKAHLFTFPAPKGRFPLAALEGFGAESEVLIARATTSSVEVMRSAADPEALYATTSPFRVGLDDLFVLEGAEPLYRMKFTLPDREAKATFDIETGWPLYWARMDGMLTYVGHHSSVKVALDMGSKSERLEGLGVMEHARGQSLPFDFTGLLPFHFHWDVLSFPSPGAPFDSAAGLSIGRNGRTALRLRGFAKPPGGVARPMRGLSVRYLETETVDDGPHGRWCPIRWQGDIRGRTGGLCYEARTTTTPALIIPGGGMLGFEFEGEWTPSSGRPEPVAGTGFTEYGDFSGTLARCLRRA